VVGNRLFLGRRKVALQALEVLPQMLEGSDPLIDVLQLPVEHFMQTQIITGPSALDL